MKYRIDNYSWVAATGAITFTDLTTVKLDGVLVITNVTDNIIIYNFAVAGLGGTVATNVLTVTYDTSGMDNADKLQIWYEDGIPFGGHLNIVTVRKNAVAAQANVALVTVSAGTRIVVTECEVLVDRACTVDVQARIGFGAAATPTTTGVVLTHPGIGPGSGVIRGNGAGILGIGADGEDLWITSQVPTGGSIDSLVTYYTIKS